MKILLSAILLTFATFAFGIVSPTKCTNDQYKEHYNCHVQDFSNLLRSNEVQILEKKLYDYEKKTGAEFHIVTIPALGYDDVESYAQELFDKWKIGKEHNDNGLLILLCSDPNNRVWRIQPGYGLEVSITDAYSKRVGENVMVPLLKQGKIFDALDATTNKIIEKINGDEKIEQELAVQKSLAEQQTMNTGGSIESPESQFIGGVTLVSILSILGFVFLVILFIKYIKRRNAIHKSIVDIHEQCEQQYERISEIVKDNAHLITEDMRIKFNGFYPNPVKKYFFIGNYSKDIEKLKQQQKWLLDFIKPVETYLEAQKNFIEYPKKLKRDIQSAMVMFTNTVTEEGFHDMSNLDPAIYEQAIDKLFVGENLSVDQINKMMSEGSKVTNDYVGKINSIINDYHIKLDAQTIIQSYHDTIDKLKLHINNTNEIIGQINKEQALTIWEYCKTSQEDQTHPHLELMNSTISQLLKLIAEKDYVTMETTIKEYHKSVVFIKEWVREIRAFRDLISESTNYINVNVKSVNGLFEKIVTAVSHVDVKQSTKLMVNDYKIAVNKANNSGNTIEKQINLKNVLTLGQKIITQASSDIDEARKARLRREQERQASLERARLATIRRNTTQTSSYRSSSYTSRGGGGGRSGGGGANGRW